MNAIVELKNVSFSAQDQIIVREFSYAFNEGKCTAIVGPSGSGKSTVLKLAAGLLVPTEGGSIFRGKDIFSMSRRETLDFRREAAVVFQDSALWANQTVLQILELPLRIHFPKMTASERAKRVLEVLDEVGYKRDTSIRPAKLSMGEQKLIGFARALLCRPSLLFLDEWTESLDDSSSQRLIHLVRRHLSEKNTAIFVSHDFRIVRNLADYIVMIVGGKLKSIASREQMEEDEDLAQHIEFGTA